MKTILMLGLICLVTIKSFACSCECTGDCSFQAVSSKMEFVALIKVVEYSDFLDFNIDNSDQKMPYSMTVEIIQKYKGTESRKTIKLWGDNGILCRPYISNFEIGKYYLIAPNLITTDSEIGKTNDYDFFVCWTDYLEVDYENKTAYGNYSNTRKKITLEKFEKKFE